MIQRSRSFRRNTLYRPAGRLSVMLCVAVLCASSSLAQNTAPPLSRPPSEPTASRTTQDTPPVIHRAPGKTTYTQGGSSPFSTPYVGGALEPDRPHITQMLMRGDVRGELNLDKLQRETLDMQKGTAGDALRRQARQDAKRIQDLQSEGENLSPGERPARAREVREAIQQDHLVFESEADKRTLTALTPAQIKRVVELDLQWRGPFALSTPNLADTLQLSDTQRAAIEAEAKAFMDAQNDALRAAAASLRPPAPALPQDKSVEQSARVQNGRGTSIVEIHTSLVTLTPEQTRARDLKTVVALQPLQPARQAGEARILALLTPEQRQQWKALLGSPFAFRPNL